MDPSYFGLQYSLRDCDRRRSFTSDEIRKIPENLSGVYAIWLVDEPIYVGMAKSCLRRRLLAHLNNDDVSVNRCLYTKIGKRGIFGGGVVSFSAIPVPTRDLVPELEKALIQEWQPECNRQFL